MPTPSRIALVLPLLLAACGTSDETKTTTMLDAVEVQPGSASDAMIMLDDADVDGTAVDNSGALTAEGAAAAKAEQAAETAPVDEAAEEEAPEAESETEQ